ncbi:MAG: hypothetical protein OXI67_18425 [Candidatus Poribacteria bacterium]|nr:hypothetical protein [Candidatus Poribacteria bacterium]
MKLYGRKHKMCVLIVCLMTIVVLSSCGKLEGEPQSESLYKDDTLDLFEAFFRYKFENNHSGVKQNADAYFLQIKKKDPSSEFLTRFKKHSPPVKMGSKFVVGKGILFRIDKYKQIGRNSVEIRGGYYVGNLSASWAPYLWERKNGKWVLKSVGPVIVA